MAIVNVSLDTKTRNVVLTINGILVAQDGCSIDRYIDYEGEENIYFTYTVESIDGSGMKERRMFTLPSPEEASVMDASELDENGFASNTVHDDEKAKADTIDFLKKRTDSK